MRWGATVLTVALLIALVLASGCADVSFGSQKIGDFGSTKEEQKAVEFFKEKYGDPLTNSGPARFLEPMVTTGLVNNTPKDKVTKFSKDTGSIFFWVFYDNLKKGDTLTLTWTFNGKTVISLQREAGGDFGRAFGEFIKPDKGWVSGKHTITITGGGTSATSSFEIIDGATVTESLPYEQAGSKTQQLSVNPNINADRQIINQPDAVSENRKKLFTYLQDHPRIRAQMRFETDRVNDQSTYLYYDQWPDEWKERLLTFLIAYETGTSLPMDIPSYTSPSDGTISYRDTNTARDVYLAQVAYALWLDMSGKVPWHMEDWPDQELSYLLSSKVFFSATPLFDPNSIPHDKLAYVVYWSSREEATENVLGDPRIPFSFMEKEPEQGNQLLGTTPGETGAKLSGWFNDYLFHVPDPALFHVYTFYRDHPRLEDRLKRYPVPPFTYGTTTIDPGSVYLAQGGCGGASALFADLMRSVNIPVRKINNKIENPSGIDESHSGLLFNWSGGGRDARFLLHTDDLYTTGWFYNPSPAPKGSDGSIALWDQVWLDPTAFSKVFSLSSEPGIYAHATKEQNAKYLEMRSLLLSSPWVIGRMRNSNHDAEIALMKHAGYSEQEAEACWQAVEASALTYGDADRDLGFQRLLDGPDSRFGQWCTKTKKCIIN